MKVILNVISTIAYCCKLVRSTAIAILRRWAVPEISATVERYWADPENTFEEMLIMVFIFSKSTMKDIGEIEE
jgi:hypothetical protein